MILESLTQALSIIFSVNHFSFLLLGLCLGLIAGLLPGLSGTTGVLLIFPFLTYIDPISALAMLCSLIAVVTISDSFSSVLLGIPGSAASQATILDGHPMTKQGKAYQALGAAFSSSVLGGLFGAFVLSIFIYYARPIILYFTTAELLMLALLGLTYVGLLHRENSFKGVLSCFLGLVIGTIGSAPSSGDHRFTWGNYDLYEGIPIVVVALGIFAIPEILSIYFEKTSPIKSTQRISDFLKGFKETLKNKWLVLRCSTLGAIVGAIPGLGGAVVDWFAYGHTVSTSKDKSKFGNGDVRGVIGPESANTAKEGGALIPTLLFGIPGSGTMILLLLALDVIDMYPSLNFIEENLSTIYVIVWSLVIATLIGAILCIILAKPLTKFLSIKYYILCPVLLAIIVTSVYYLDERFFDLICLFVFAIVGFVMRAEGWSRPALLLGLVLSPIIEKYFYQAMEFHGWQMFERPIVLFLLFNIVLSFFIMGKKKKLVSDKSNFVFVVSAFFIFYATTLFSSSFYTLVFPISLITSYFIYLIAKKLSIKIKNLLA